MFLHSWKRFCFYLGIKIWGRILVKLFLTLVYVFPTTFVDTTHNSPSLLSHADCSLKKVNGFSCCRATTSVSNMYNAICDILASTILKETGFVARLKWTLQVYTGRQTNLLQCLCQRSKMVAVLTRDCLAGSVLFVQLRGDAVYEQLSVSYQKLDIWHLTLFKNLRIAACQQTYCNNTRQ